MFYYFRPFKRQYYFQKGFEKYMLFNSFYHPYKFSSKVIWYLWRNNFLVRSLFVEKDINKIIDINKIGKYLSHDTIIAINLGTEGVEQKTTVIGVEVNAQNNFFIKYSDSNSVKQNIENEARILSKYKHLDFIPRLNQFISENSFTLIKTSFLLGNKYSYKRVNNEILEIILLINKQEKIRNKKLKECFSHGDFCPWNMILNKGNLKIFDWEHAGFYPLGYDLFTYIFQSLFLIKKKNNINNIILKNKKIIEKYFNFFSINDWTQYLIIFSELKYQNEKNKQNIQLINLYKKLKLHAEKL